jgi:hypothetical protein
MHITFIRRWTVALAVYLVAIAFGVVATFVAAGTPAAASVLASCTRYHPDTSPNTLCGTWTGAISGFGCSNGFALRTENWVITEFNRDLYVTYEGGDCSDDSWFATASNTTYLSIGSSGGSARAECKIGGAAVNGACTTTY